MRKWVEDWHEYGLSTLKVGEFEPLNS